MDGKRLVRRSPFGLAESPDRFLAISTGGHALDRLGGDDHETPGIENRRGLPNPIPVPVLLAQIQGFGGHS